VVALDAAAQVAGPSGPIHGAAITEALSAYNLAANGHCPLLVPVAWNELMGWAEIHHILTARYADNSRYPFPWDQARPS
jgi:hypothetical protein